MIRDLFAGLARLKALVGPEFLRNVLVVMTGTAMAQLLGLAFSPILSRLFGPADFGAFGTFFSIVAVAGAAATLNYADTIMLPKEDEQAAPLLMISCLSAVAVAGATALFILLAPQSLLRLAGLGELGWLVWLAPPAVLLLGIGQALSFWCTRIRAFKQTSQSQVVRSIVICGSQTGAGLLGLGGAGLVSGGVLADAGAALFLGWASLKRSRSLFLRCAGWRRLVHQAVEFREFALYGAPQNLMNALSLGLPVLVLNHYYGMAVAGCYAFGLRLLQVPINFFQTSLRQVLFQRLSHISSHGGNLYRPFLKCTGTLALLCALPACAGFWAAPGLFALVFGEQWRTGGEFGRWLILWLVPQFCNLPASLAFRIMRLQRELFFFDVTLLAARAASLVLGGMLLPAHDTVIVLSIVGAVFNLFFISYIAVRLRALRTNRPGAEVAGPVMAALSDS